MSRSQPTYLLVMGKGYTEAWYQLSKEEQDWQWSRVADVDQRARANWLRICKSRWADEVIWGWEVIEYPDLEAYQKKVEELEKLNWWRYVSAKTISGTKMGE